MSYNWEERVRMIEFTKKQRRSLLTGFVFIGCGIAILVSLVLMAWF